MAGTENRIDQVLKSASQLRMASILDYPKYIDDEFTIF